MLHYLADSHKKSILDWGFRAQTLRLSDCSITLRKAFIWKIRWQTLTLPECSVIFRTLVNSNTLRLLRCLADSCKKSIHLELLCSGSNTLRLLHCLEDSYQKGLYGQTQTVLDCSIILKILVGTASIWSNLGVLGTQQGSSKRMHFWWESSR